MKIIITISMILITLVSSQFNSAAATEKTPVNIEYNDNDYLGKLVVLNIKAIIKNSPKYKLSNLDTERKYTIKIRTIDPYKGKEKGKAIVYYCIYFWSEKLSKDTHTMYIKDIRGIFGKDNVEKVADQIVKELETRY
jgi:hypothetical protein